MSMINLKDIFPDNDIFNDRNVMLHPIQATALRYLMEIERYIGTKGHDQGCILGDDMGSGKSHVLAALMVCNPVPKTIVITPKNTINQLSRRILDTCSGFFSVYTFSQTLKQISKSGKSVKFGRTKGLDRYSILIINREQLESSNFKEKFKDQRWFRLIIDEVHDFRNDTSYDEGLKNLKKGYIKINGKKVTLFSTILSTGTPIQNSIMDLVKLYRIINPSFQKDKSESEIDMEALRKHNKKYLFRREISNFTEELKRSLEFPISEPIKKILTIKLKSTSLSREVSGYSWSRIKRLYESDRQFRRQLIRDEKAFITAVCTKQKEKENSDMTGLKIALSNPFRGAIFVSDSSVFHSEEESEYRGKNSKSEKLLELISTENDDSYVIFHENTYSKNMYLDKIEELDNFVIRSINGEMKIAERTKALEDSNLDIQNGRRVILTSSLKATSVGICYNYFNVAIFIDHNANPQDENQAIARLQRMKQLRQVYVYHITYDVFKISIGDVGTDDRLFEIKSNKNELVSILSPNAAYEFNHYKSNYGGKCTSGLIFGKKYEEREGKKGGINSKGPIDILEFSEEKLCKISEENNS